MENEPLIINDAHNILNQLQAVFQWIRNNRQWVVSFVFILCVISMVNIEEIPVHEEYKFIIPHIATAQKVLQKIWPWNKKEISTVYEPRNVLAEFNYTPTGDASLTDLNLTFVNINQGIDCKLWEGISNKALIKVIESFGEENNFTKNQIAQMVLGTEAAFHVNSVEVFQHGMQGLFRYTIILLFT